MEWAQDRLLTRQSCAGELKPVKEFGYSLSLSSGC